MERKLRFIVSEAPIMKGGMKGWKVVQVSPQPPKLVAYFFGPTPELAPLIAGDYVEFLNEKYFDKVMNEDWPPRTKEQYIEYYKERLRELEND